MFPFFVARCVDINCNAVHAIDASARWRRTHWFMRTDGPQGSRPLPRVRRGRGRGPGHVQARRRRLRDRCARAASTLQRATERVQTNVPRVRSPSITNSTPHPTTCGALARDTVRERAPDAHVTAVFFLLTGLQAEDGRRGGPPDGREDRLERSRRSACDQSDLPPFAVQVTATPPPWPSSRAFLPSAAHA